MNIAIIGHIDHGKSTLIGRLLYDSGAIPESRLSEMQAMAEQYKRRFEFGYFLDAFAEEIRDERTVDTTETVFKGEKLHTIIDVPGHKEFTTAMLTGACHADAAVLVVDGTKGLEEQSRRHLYLAHMLGIRKFIVAVNKMDLLEYDKAKFNVVIMSVSSQLPEGVTVDYIPISAYCGDNVYKKSGNMPWVNGLPTLVGQIDTLAVGKDDLDKPLRFVAQDNYDGLVVGRVESGVLKVGDLLDFVPEFQEDRVVSIETYQGKYDEAVAGDSVGLRMRWSWTNPKRGGVAYKCGEKMVKPCETLISRVIILKKKLKLGERLSMRCGTASVDATVKEIRQRLSSETGEVLRDNAKSANEYEVAMVGLELGGKVAVERFCDMPQLGRITLAENGRVVCAGIVEDIGV